MFEKRDIFKEFTRAEAIRKQAERERLREETLDQRRRNENAAIIQAPGEGCEFCLDGAKSDSTSDQKDICRARNNAYLPIYMNIADQRPTWCPGFERNGEGVAVETGTLKLETRETNENEHQEELPL
jgi:hypothetical protein